MQKSMEFIVNQQTQEVNDKPPATNERLNVLSILDRQINEGRNAKP
jgi:hypothetical protein